MLKPATLSTWRETLLCLPPSRLCWVGGAGPGAGTACWMWSSSTAGGRTQGSAAGLSTLSPSHPFSSLVSAPRGAPTAPSGLGCPEAAPQHPQMSWSLPARSSPAFPDGSFFTPLFTRSTQWGPRRTAAVGEVWDEWWRAGKQAQDTVPNPAPLLPSCCEPQGDGHMVERSCQFSHVVACTWRGAACEMLPGEEGNHFESLSSSCRTRILTLTLT